MNERSDLTRWNRAGLSRFRYVDGNAVEYLELLRRKLAARFADPQSGLCDWLNPPEQVPANELAQDSETLIQRQERLSLRHKRLLETYHQDRRDWAWEISRSFARCCHILTEYADAYANEGFLATATQWEHVRRLVEMLDYHPAPPASAATWLTFFAKPGKSGTVARGFQVKNSPPTGGDKVIFETLHDLHLDAAQNVLRPKGWNRSDDAMGATGNDDSPASPGGESRFSVVAQGPAINIQGVGAVQASKLDALLDDGEYRILDFPGLDPDRTDIGIEATWLREWKTKADLIINFAAEGNWSAISEWLLPEIAAASAESLADLSGNSLEQATALKLDIGTIDICLDRPVFAVTPFKDLLTLVVTESDVLEMSWSATAKPAVEPDEVALVIDTVNGRAEAVTIGRVEEGEAKESLLSIELLVSPVQYSWRDWAKGDTRLRFSSRWQRKSWLNGADVIRTVEPHGLSAESFVGWKESDIWQYAEILEADRRNLRLDCDGPLPATGTELYQLNPIDGSKVDPQFEVIVLLGEEADGGDVRDAVESVPPSTGEPPSTDSIFTITELDPPSTSGGGLLPPASLPGIGSFLFPSPMLPIDLVKAAVELMLSLGVMQIPSTGEFVIKGLPFGELLEEAENIGDAAENLFFLLDGLTMKMDDGSVQPMIQWVEPGLTANKPKLENLLRGSGDAESALFQEIKEGIERKGPLLAISKQAPTVATVDDSDPLYMFDRDADKIKTGYWVVGRFSDGLRALKVDTVHKYKDEEKNDTFSLGFENLTGNVGELKTVYADFRGEAIPEGAATNRTPVDPENLELEAVPESLAVCQQVLLTGDDKEPALVKITSIDGNTITTSPPATGFTKGELVINANVARIGHGEGKPEKILGSGDAARSNQEFILEVEAVSFIPDAIMSSGVAAAVDVIVDGRVWKQASTLKDSAPDDHHYVVRMTEAGYVKLLFGDGRYGRRLPSGKNNIRVRYRVGAGTAGNVPARSLEKPVNPHPLVDSVYQWLPAAGGGDMEGLDSLKKNAPPTLLALERAVSLSDFSHLAASQSSIWQARAYSEILHGGRTENVRVIIVAAGGVSSEDIKSNLRTFLQQHALPGVEVAVDYFTPERFSLTITIRVDSAAFSPAPVLAAVESALIGHFALKNRRLGEHLYLSEVYKIVEGVEGVENSICVLNEDEELKVIHAEDDRTVIHLDLEAGSTLTATAEEYRP